MPIVEQFQMNDPFSSGINTGADIYNGINNSRQAAQDSANALAQQAYQNKLAQAKEDEVNRHNVADETGVTDRNKETNRHNVSTETTAVSGLAIRQNEAKDKHDRIAAQNAADAALTAVRRVTVLLDQGKIKLQDAQKKLALVDARLAGVRADFIPQELQAKINDAKARLAETIRHNGVTEGQGAQRIAIEQGKSKGKGKGVATAGEEGAANRSRATAAFNEGLQQGFAKKDPDTGALIWKDPSTLALSAPARKLYTQLKGKYDGANQAASQDENAIAGGSTVAPTSSPSEKWVDTGASAPPGVADGTINSDGIHKVQNGKVWKRVNG